MTAEQPIDVLEAMGTARTMRFFQPDPVPDELVEKVLWAGTRASNPNNTQPWDFIVVRDAEVRAALGGIFAPVAAAASPATDMSATTRRTFEGAVNLMASLAAVPVIIVICGVNAYPAYAPDERYMYSAMHAAGQNMLVAARALGLGAAFTALHMLAEDEFRRILGIPDDRAIGVTMPLGWPAKPFGPVTRRPVSDIVHHDRW